MTTQTQDDLAAICTTLSATIAIQDEKITAATARLGELQQELASIGRNKMNYAVDIEQTSLAAGRLQALVTQAMADARLAKGTSLEAEIERERATAVEQLARAESQLSALHFSFENDSQAERDTTATVLELQNALAAQVSEKQDAVASRERWSRDLCSAIAAHGVEVLSEVDSELARLRAETQTAEHFYDQVLYTTALDLAKRDERNALDFLATHGRWDDNPPTVVAAQVQLAEAKEDLAQVIRSRAQSGDASLNTTVMGYEQQVRNLVARIEQLRQQHRQDAAMALLRRLQQPAPMVDSDLLQAQALAQAMAQAEVVVEAPVPERETHTLTSGQHSLGHGVIGAVPKPVIHAYTVKDTSTS